MKNRTIIVLLLLTVISSFFPISLKAEETSKTLKVGYMGYRSFIEKRDNKYRGFGADYLTEIARYQDFEYKFIKDSWENLMKQLENGEIDILCTAEKSEDRLNRFLYSETSLGYVSTLLYTLPDKEDIYYEDYEAFNDLKVGILKGSVQYQAYLDFEKKNQISSKVNLYPSFDAMEEALNKQEVDAIATESLNKRSDLKLLAQFNSSPFYFMTNKNNKDLMDQMNSAMNEINSNTPYFQTDLYYKYYGGNQISSSPPYTKKEVAYIKQLDAYNCGYLLEAYPLSFKDKNRPSGILYSLLEEISDLSGLTFTYTPLESYNKGFKSLKNNKIDFLLNYTDYFNVSYSNVNHYSDALFDLPMSLISKDIYLNDTRGLTLGVAKDRYLPMENELKHLFQIENIKYYANYDAAINAVKNNEVNFTIINSYLVNTILQDENNSSLKSSNIKEAFPISIGYSKNVDTMTRKIVNKTIPFLSKDTKDAVLQSLISKNAKNDISNYGSYIRIIVIVSIAVIALLIFIYLKSSQKIRKNKIYDSLCDCYNLKTFKEKATLALKENKSLAQYIIAVDLQHFSYVNHYYGNIVGDDVLRRFCNIIKNRIHANDIIGRFAKDEFILFVNEFPNLEGTLLLNRIPEEIIEKMGLDLKLNIKIGIYEIINHTDDIDMMIEKALMAKRNLEKTSIYKFYSPEMDENYETIGEIEMNKENALKNKEFQVYFQPKIDLKTEKIVGAEALVRWIKKDGSILPPDAFIPIFEKSNFIKKLDLYTLKKVCSTIKEYGFEFPISINQSRVLLNDENYSEDLIKILTDSKIDASKIEIEVTESMYIRDKERLSKVVTMLHNLNIAISIDDFGSGYSSLNLLTQLPVEIVKIDKSVLDTDAKQKHKETLIKSIINMAHEMEMCVVCEGVETVQQRDMLKRLNCDIAQGYFYSKPMSLDNFLKFIEENANKPFV